MGQHINLDSASTTIDAYLAKPDGPSKGGIVVIQEIFGVNGHIRDVVDRFAAAGYTAIAPALFDSGGNGRGARLRRGRHEKRHGTDEQGRLRSVR